MKASADSTAVSVSNGGGGNMSWTATLPADAKWVRIVGEAGGTNSGAVALTADANAGAARSTALTITAGGVSTVVPIDQTAAVTRTPDRSWQEGPVGWTFTYEDYNSANKPWAMASVEGPEAPVRYGFRSERFELRVGDCGGPDCTRSDGVRERSEFAQNGVENYEGETYWYGWSFFVPPDFKESGNLAGTEQTVTLAQFHQKPTDTTGHWFPAWMFGKPFNGDFNVRSFPSEPTMKHATFPLIEHKDFAGHWHDMVVQARWTEKEDGFLRIWVNNQLKMDYSGKTRSPNNDYVYFKYGVYRPSNPANPANAVIYFDEVRRGKTREDVDIRLIEARMR